tara:strand:+ start:3655 stop:4074 length:420 start_codon:yes stop_codon:yes gene_type:complete
MAIKKDTTTVKNLDLSKIKVKTNKKEVSKKKVKTKEINTKRKASLLKPKTHMVYLYYMTGCPHCDAMKDEWKKAKDYLYDEQKNVTEIEREFVGNIKNELLQDVNVFPLIIAFDKDNNKIDYNDYRTSDCFTRFIQRYG